MTTIEEINQLKIVTLKIVKTVKLNNYFFMMNI